MQKVNQSLVVSPGNYFRQQFLPFASLAHIYIMVEAHMKRRVIMMVGIKIFAPSFYFEVIA